MDQYLSMQREVLERGVKKEDRTNTGTISAPGVVRRYDIRGNRLAAVSTKKIHIKTGQVEEDWMISGDTRLKFLKENNCNIWDEWVLEGTGTYRPRLLKEMRRAYKRNHFGWEEPGVFSAGSTEEEIEHWTLLHVGDDYKIYVFPNERHMVLDKSDNNVNVKRWEDKEDPLWFEFYTALGISDQEVVDGELGKVYGAMFRSIPDTRMVDPLSNEEHMKMHARGFEYMGSMTPVSDDVSTKDIYHRDFDQFAELLKNLEHNPDSRRLILCPWNPLFVDEQALPPCHSFIQFWTRELDPCERYDIYVERFAREQKELYQDIAKRSHADIYTTHAPYPLDLFCTVIDNAYQRDDVKLHAYCDALNIPRRGLTCLFYMRSNDVFLGAPYNLTFYSSLTHKLAHQFNMYGEELIHMVGDAHIYLNHLDQVDLQQQRIPDQELPRLKINLPVGTSILDMTYHDLEVIGYNPQPAIEAPVAV
jgi:thymidylate synthase